MDKQIIIDGVDVSDCEYLDNINFDGLCLMLSSPYECQVNCSNKPNCHYKQLNAKEQECERLNDELYYWVNGEYCDNKCNVVKELDQLKAENEDLQEQIRKHNDDMFKNPPEKRFYCKGCTLPYVSKKFKQTLTEIKEMLKEICMEECLFDWNKTSKKHCGDCDCRYGQILQKISEVENEN